MFAIAGPTQQRSCGLSLSSGVLVAVGRFFVVLPNRLNREQSTRHDTGTGTCTGTCTTHHQEPPNEPPRDYGACPCTLSTAAVGSGCVLPAPARDGGGLLQGWVSGFHVSIVTGYPVPGICKCVHCLSCVATACATPRPFFKDACVTCVDISGWPDFLVYAFVTLPEKTRPTRLIMIAHTPLCYASLFCAARCSGHPSASFQTCPANTVVCEGKYAECVTYSPSEWLSAEITACPDYEGAAYLCGEGECTYTPRTGHAWACVLKSFVGPACLGAAGMCMARQLLPPPFATYEGTLVASTARSICLQLLAQLNKGHAVSPFLLASSWLWADSLMCCQPTTGESCAASGAPCYDSNVCDNNICVAPPTTPNPLIVDQGGRAITQYTSAWRTIWIRDVFFHWIPALLLPGVPT